MMSLPVWLPGSMFLRGGGLCPGRVSAGTPHRIRIAGGTHPSGMHSCPVTGSVIEEKFDMQTDCKIIFPKHLQNFHPQSKCFLTKLLFDMISKIF